MNDLILFEEYKSDLPRPDHIPPVSTVTKRAGRARAIQIAATVAVVGVLAVAVPAVAKMGTGSGSDRQMSAAAVLARIETRPAGQYVHLTATMSMTATGAGADVPQGTNQVTEGDMDLLHQVARIRSGGDETVITEDAIYQKKKGQTGWVRLANPESFEAFLKSGANATADPNSLLKDLTAKQIGRGLRDGGVIDGVPTWRFDLDPKKFLGKAFGSLGPEAEDLLKDSQFRMWVGHDGQLRKLQTRVAAQQGRYGFSMTMVMTFTKWDVPVQIDVPKRSTPASGEQLQELQTFLGKVAQYSHTESHVLTPVSP